MNKWKNWAVTALLLLGAQWCFANDNPKPTLQFAPAPAWVQPLDIQDVLSKKASAEPVDYLQVDTQTLLSGRQTKRYLSFVSRANTPTGVSQISEVKLSFDPSYETLTIHSIVLRRNGQVLDKLDASKFKLIQQESELNNSIYNGVWTALYVIQDIRQGDVVEYHYSIDGQNPIFGDKYVGSTQLTWQVPIAKRHFSLLVDGDVRLNVHSQRDGISLQKTRVDDKTLYSVTLRDRQADAEEDRVPHNILTFDFIEYSEFKDWADVVRWALPLYQFDKSGAELEQRITLLAQKTKDPLARADQAIKMVQDEVRYFGVEFGTNSHKPSAPHETFGRRYGDCKDKAALLSYVLTKLGVPAYPALVSTEMYDYVEKQQPSPTAFNHVIVQYNVGKQMYWVDPTYAEQAGTSQNRTLPPYKKALVIQPAATALTAIVAQNPAQQSATLNVTEHFRFLNATATDMDIEVVTEFTGWVADETRVQLKMQLTDNYEKLVKEAFQKWYKQTDVVTPVVVEDNIAENKLTLKHHFIAKSPQDDAAARAEYAFFPAHLRDYVLNPQVRNRKHPFAPMATLVAKQTTYIEFPEARKIVYHTELDERTVKSGSSDFKRVGQKKDNQIRVDYQLTTTTGRIQPNELQAYIDANDDIVELLGLRVWTQGFTAISKDKKDNIKNLIEKLRSKQ